MGMKEGTMRRFQPAALAVIALTAMLWSSRANISEARVRRVQFQMLATEGGRFTKIIDENGTAGTGPGDWGIVKSKVIAVDGCKNAGNIFSRFVFITGGPKPDAILDLGLATPQGNLVAYFADNFGSVEGKGLHGAVTGGTARYRDATGQVTLVGSVTRCGKKGDLYSFDLLLTRPAAQDEPSPTPTPATTPSPTFTPTLSPTPTVIPAGT